MTVTACALAALLAFESAAAPECALTDNRCKARQYEHRASATSVPGSRALYLYNAYRSYLILFEKAGHVGDLCEARRTLQASLAVQGQPQDQRSMSRSKQEDLAALVRLHGAHCKPTKKRSSQHQTGGKAATIHRAPPQAIEVPELLELPPRAKAPATLATQAAPPPGPAPMTPLSPPSVVQRSAESIAVQGPVSPPPLRLVNQRSWVRIGVGLGLLTVGVGLAAGMTAALVGRRRSDEKIAALNARAAHEGRPPTEAEMASSLAWDDRFVRLERTGVVLGGLAAASLVAAVVVLVLPRRGGASQAKIQPVGAGIHIKF